MASDISTALIPESDYDLWASFVAECPEGSPYALPGYLDALCSATGGRFRVLGVYRGEELAGGLALYDEDRTGGRVASPRLLLYYNGPVLRRYETRYPSERTSRYLKVMWAMAEWLETAGLDRIALKCLPGLSDARAFLARGWSAFPTYSYVVPLDDMEAAWKRVEQNARRLVGRAQKEGLTVTDDDDFESFYRLHEATMDRKDRNAYLPREAFRSFVTSARRQELAALYHARLPDGRAVATQLVLLGPVPVAHIVSAAADEEHASLGTNPFLRWRSFEALAERGYAGVDLTDASLNPVTRFKSQLGGDLTLSLELQSTPSARWRRAQARARLLRRARGAAGRVVRTLRPGDSG